MASLAGQPRHAGAFAQALGQVRQAQGSNTNAESLRTVSTGDTLIGMVRQQAVNQGVTLSPAQEFRIAQRVASDNGIADPNCIFPGQQIKLNLQQPELQTAQRLAPVPLAGSAVPAVAAVPAISATASSGSANPVLDQTLTRAVAKGFIPAQEKEAVYDKILQLASTHRFNPDDFARMTLMESDGMNPRAILDLSVHKQLSLVDKYFEEVGLKNQGSNGLEDLYLSVLRPASRSEGPASAALNIPGLQSSYLHVGRDTSAPITRQSIRQGLLQNAAERLGQLFAPTASRLQAMRSAEVGGGAN